MKHLFRTVKFATLSAVPALGGLTYAAAA